MTGFDDKLRLNAAEIERALDTLLDACRLAGPGEPPARLVAAMRHGTLEGGKRLRPFLLRQTAQMGGFEGETAFVFAPAILGPNQVQGACAELFVVSGISFDRLVDQDGYVLSLVLAGFFLDLDFGVGVYARAKRGNDDAIYTHPAVFNPFIRLAA